ncbi:MAG TPA: SDR family oxidoreductase [Thermoanaerobaculia bacterium]|jgi:short-subunit dehydrogenase|nr:SDR family oxidoreductase [Thermoanaerobaculia bacterium]
MAEQTGTGGRQTALITGASGGIGLELARRFAAGGYDLVLVARSTAKLEELAGELRKHGAAVRVLAKDLARPESPEEVFQELEAAEIAVDVLVNNAGFATYGPFVEIDLGRELEELQLNVVTLTHLTKKLLPGMLARRRGGVLNLASTAGFQPGPLMAVYYATKAYVISFSEALAEELSGTGVTVTALCPGPTATGFQRRAGLEASKLFSGMLQVADAAAVARAGYEGFRAGKRIVIPGLINKIGVQSIRISPRALATRMVKRMQERRR